MRLSAARLFVLSCVMLAHIGRPAHAFHGDVIDDVRCELCGPHTYCLNGEENFCPPQSLSVPYDFPSEIDDCICNPGYLELINTHECQVGQPPHYYFEGKQFDCPVHKLTTVTLAGYIDKCVCDIGFRADGVWSGDCVECAHGKFNGVTNRTSCEACPANSFHEQTRQTVVTSCLCNAGFTGADGGPCAECAGGTFKGVSGSAECGTCVADTFSNGTAATACANCAVNSVSSEGSTVASDCKCNSGFAVTPSTVGNADEHSCEPCAIGFAKPETDNLACTVCASGKYADVTQLSACKACGSDSTHSPPEAPDKCLCNPGFYLTPDSPNPVSADECTQCPADTYKPSLSNPLTDCLACADGNMVSATGSDDRLDCRCKEGFREVPAEDGGFKAEAERECVQCLAGEYKMWGSAGVPSACRPARPTPSLCPAVPMSQLACVRLVMRAPCWRRTPASWDTSSQRLALAVLKAAGYV